MESENKITNAEVMIVTILINLGIQMYLLVEHSVEIKREFMTNLLRSHWK